MSKKDRRPAKDSTMTTVPIRDDILLEAVRVPRGIYANCRIAPHRLIAVAMKHLSLQTAHFSDDDRIGEDVSDETKRRIRVWIGHHIMPVLEIAYDKTKGRSSAK